MALKTLIYAQDTLGLGHVRRCVTIARALLDARADASVLLASKSSWPARVALGDRFDFLKLPSQFTLAGASPAEHDAEREAIRALRRDLLRDAAARLRPQLVLVDNEPLGFKGEMVQALAAAEGAKVVFGMRDVLDDPERTAESWAALDVVASLRSRFDGVLVYGHPELFDTLGTYGVPADIAARAHYTGYVVTPGAAVDVAAARARLGCDERPVVLVTGGGGQDAVALCTTAVGALGLLTQRPSPRGLIVTGPFMPQEDRAVLAELARGGDHMLVESVDMSEAMAAADAVVTMGGYNTLAEAMMLGRRPIVVPRATHKREQLMRALAFDRHGLVRCLVPGAASAEALAQALEAELRTPSAIDAGRFLDVGATRTAQLLLELGSA